MKGYKKGYKGWSKSKSKKKYPKRVFWNVFTAEAEMTYINI